MTRRQLARCSFIAFSQWIYIGLLVFLARTFPDIFDVNTTPWVHPLVLGLAIIQLIIALGFGILRFHRRQKPALLYIAVIALALFGFVCTTISIPAILGFQQ